MKKILCIIFFSAFIFSGYSQKKFEYTPENIKDYSIVNDSFGNKNQVLICVIRPKGRSKLLEKYIKKKYKGDYVFVYKKNLTLEFDFNELGPYSDKEKYRYILDYYYDKDLSKYDPSVNIAYGNKAKYINVYLYDRVEEKQTGSHIIQKTNLDNTIEFVVVDLNNNLK